MGQLCRRCRTRFQQPAHGRERATAACCWRILAPDDGGRESVEEIVEAADRAAALTRQLLAFSRRQLFDARTLDLNVLVGDLHKMLQRLVPATIRIDLVTDPTLGAVHADAGQIEQAIMNLVVNARDAMPGGGTLTISTANIDVLRRPPPDGCAPPGSVGLLLDGHRHRDRNGRADARAHFRAVLHDQGARTWHGAGPLDGLRDRAAERRVRLASRAPRAWVRHSIFCCLVCLLLRRKP